MTHSWFSFFTFSCEHKKHASTSENCADLKETEEKKNQSLLNITWDGCFEIYFSVVTCRDILGKTLCALLMAVIISHRQYWPKLFLTILLMHLMN